MTEPREIAAALRSRRWAETMYEDIALDQEAALLIERLVGERDEANKALQEIAALKHRERGALGRDNYAKGHAAGYALAAAYAWSRAEAALAAEGGGDKGSSVASLRGRPQEAPSPDVEGP